ncbi:MAG: CvpA family protein [Candidatus Dadabacteria bacterium]
MNLVDLILVIIVLLATWAGWSKGFIKGFVDLVIWVGTLVTGFVAAKPLGNVLANIFPSLDVWSIPLAFILAVVLTRILLALFFGSFLRSTDPALHRSPVNHILGIVPGLVNGVLYATIIAALLLTLPLSDTISGTTKNSRIAGQLTGQVQWLDNKISPIFSDAAKEAMKTVTVEPESNETVLLHYTVTNATPRADLESKMLQMVNNERTSRGLPALQYDPELTKVARDHSRDMFERGYFSHYTPERKDPFDRMKEAHVKFLAAGENLALGQSLNVCHTGLMNSPGHRANILHKSFHRVGIGILDGGIHGLMISQEFRD